MEARLFEDEDYEAVCSWWKYRGWPAISLDMLPQIGAIVDGKAAGFLYRTDSSLCWLEWVVAAKDGGDAVELVLDFLIGRAKQLGCKVIFTSLNHPKLIKLYEKAGFVKTDESMTNMIWAATQS